MDLYQEEGVFNLITKLCEKFCNEPYKIKEKRIKCYEILLGKKVLKHKEAFADPKGSPNPLCNFYVWQFKLCQEYGFRDHANELENCVTSTQNLYDNPDDFYIILDFLLHLKNLPSKDENKLDLSVLPPIAELENFSKLFKLPADLLIESENFCSETFLSKSDIFKTYDAITSQNAVKIEEDISKDEGYFSPQSRTPENIWEMVSKMEYSSRRNWENFGYPEPEKEKPFLSELGDLSSLWVENLESLYFARRFKDGRVYSSKMVPRTIFIRDLKYAMVGIASETFGFNEAGEFYLIPGVVVEGITPTTLNTYCADMMFSGTCYKALNCITSPTCDIGKYKYEGFIFKEFCESVNRYLKFYCTAIFTIPDTSTYLQFSEKTYALQSQISILASICKVGPFAESEEVPHGVALLNYLYQKVLSLTEQKVITVLYSVLYPCCQVYFSRFLKQWIMEGIINDPYEEFFIRCDYKYLQSRGRTYWTRSYNIREDLVPDFLVDLRFDVLSCGKAMNLLKCCNHLGKLYSYIMGENQLVISCCLTLDQLSKLKQTAAHYYLDVCNECGPPFKMSDVLAKKEEDPVLLGLIAKKRAATLKRLELQRQNMLEEEREKKNEEITMLKEQYDAAVEQKQLRIAKEIESEIEQVQSQLELELKRQQLIQKEATTMIEYYSQLMETADDKKSKIEKNMKKIQSIQIHQSPGRASSVDERAESESSNDSFHTVFEEPPTIEQHSPKLKSVEEKESEQNIQSSETLDILNANNADQHHDTNANVETFPHTIQQAIKNFEMAKRNKEKVMQQELGIDYSEKIIKTDAETSNKTYLTEAQKNKLRVLSSEFGIPLKPEEIHTTLTEAQKNKLRVLSSAFGIPLKPEEVHTTLTEAEKNKARVLSSEFGIPLKPDEIHTTKYHSALSNNRNKVMGVSNCFDFSKNLDNANFLNKNLNNIEEEVTMKQSKSLTLDFEKIDNRPAKLKFDKPLPMSVDSTPMSDLQMSMVTTPSTVYMSVDSGPFESFPNTADTQQTDEGFNFTTKESSFKEILPLRINYRRAESKKKFSKLVTKEEASAISSNCLRLFLLESIQISLATQSKLLNDGILNYFINELGYMNHLNNLRDYFFLQDGEFGRIITDNLFTKLYDANCPADLINCRTLQNLVLGALEMSSKNQERCTRLSFEMTNSPKSFDLASPNVLDCLSLTYKVEWPLNILLPINTIEKYDEVFKYLLKLSRMAWVLKKIFLELKLLAKKTGNKEIYLMSSPQYRRLHHCRHVMMHFMQTLQNYVVGEVLQSSWELFEKNLLNVTNIDELFKVHTSYIKNILFIFPKDQQKRQMWLCLLGLDNKLPRVAHICSNHFNPNDIVLNSTGSCKYLKRDAVPLSVPFPEKSEASNSDHGSDSTIFETPPKRQVEFSCLPSCSEMVSQAPPLSPIPSTSSTLTASEAEENMLKLLKGEEKNQMVELKSEFKGMLSIVESSKKRKRTYVGDLSSDDFSTPEKRTRNVGNVRKTVKNQRKKIHSLQTTVRVLRKRVTTLKSLLAYLRKQSYISEAAESTIRASVQGPAADILTNLLKGPTKQKYNPSLRCFLNQKTAALRSVIHKIFTVLLKFYNYLSSKSWQCENGAYVHPNFKKLDSIFENFLELVLYFFKVGRKVAKSGCQPHLFQLFDLLDINGYFSKSLMSGSS